MSALEWTPDHSIFVPVLDDEHKGMFEAMEGLRQLMVNGRLTAGGLKAMKEVVARATSHLTHEERLMRSSHYSAYDWHKRQHDTMRKRVTGFAGRAEQGDAAAATELLDFLKDWLRDHTGLHDRMMGAYLRNFSRAQDRSIS
jgi:hemerythrin